MKYNIGIPVRLVSTFEKNLNGKEGMLLTIGDDDLYLVSIDGFTKGHTGEGIHFESNCWWLLSYEIEFI